MIVVKRFFTRPCTQVGSVESGFGKKLSDTDCHSDIELPELLKVVHQRDYHKSKKKKKRGAETIFISQNDHF